MKRALFHKLAVVAAAIVLMVTSAAVNVYAGASGWQKDQVGWWYLNEDGSFPAQTWMQENGIWYYFNGEGYLQTGWLLWNGSWYYLEETGMATGWKYIGDAWYYFDEDGRMFSNAYVDGKYYMDENGRWDGKVQEQKKSPMFPGADAWQDLAADNSQDASNIIINQNPNNMRGLLIRNENIQWDGNTWYTLLQSYDVQAEIPGSINVITGSVGDIPEPSKPQELIPEEKNNINDEQSEIPGSISNVPQVSGSSKEIVSNDEVLASSYIKVRVINNSAYLAQVKLEGSITTEAYGKYIEHVISEKTCQLASGMSEEFYVPRDYEGRCKFTIYAQEWYLSWVTFVTVPDIIIASDVREVVITLTGSAWNPKMSYEYIKF